MPETRKPLRCLCASQRILCMYGLDDDGEIYFHLQVRKSGRLLGNIVAYGDCEIQCPNCLRWNTFHVEPGGELERETNVQPPAEIGEQDLVADLEKT